MELHFSADGFRPGSQDFDEPVSLDRTVRVLLVDDHPVVRQGIKQILADAFHDIEVGEAQDGAAALNEVRTSAWNVVVLDLSMPGQSGLDVLREIRRERPAVPVLILSMHPADQFARRAISAGASGYLTKHSGPSELVRAVHTLVEGRPYIGAPLERPGAADAPAEPRRPHEGLSDREYQVLRMIALGKTVSQIASEISLSVKTVSTYRARVLEKMGMRTTAELMRYAILNNLVD
jgi:DNA-binding NarL/FixJ family response regulator